MTIDEILKAYLETLTSKVCYVGKKPVDNDDCVVYKRISSFRSHHTQGKSLTRDRFSISVFNTDFGSADTLAQTIINGIDYNSTNFWLGMFLNRIDMTNQETGIYQINLDFYIFYK